VQKVVQVHFKTSASLLRLLLGVTRLGYIPLTAECTR